ncbi:MAG TPA: porphobilinogen synthase, partial [Nitrososphaera sp.]|nr:porphobilinogen synthase [Nitrososphaera sp.]
MQQILRDSDERYMEMFARAGLRKEHLIFPIFVSDREGDISSMPGISMMPLAKIADHIQTIASAGISSVIVFGIPKTRNNNGSSAADRNGIVQQAVRAIKSGFGNTMNVTTDVCICQYNLSGHCGIIRGGRVDNDATLEMLADIAKSHAEAGADVVAPSSMMDGQVHAIKNALGGLGTKILPYSAKHASSLYTPFRSAAFAKARLRIDKSAYQ